MHSFIIKAAFMLSVSFLHLFFIKSTLMAEDWIHVATASKTKIKSYVDLDSIMIEDENRKFTMYHHFKGSRRFRGTPIEKLIGYTFVNCGEKTIGYSEEQLELIDGRLAVKELTLKLESVRPNSVDEGILIFVCNFKK